MKFVFYILIYINFYDLKYNLILFLSWMLHNEVKLHQINTLNNPLLLMNSTHGSLCNDLEMWLRIYVRSHFQTIAGNENQMKLPQNKRPMSTQRSCTQENWNLDSGEKYFFYYYYSFSKYFQFWKSTVFSRGKSDCIF